MSVGKLHFICISVEWEISEKPTEKEGEESSIPDVS